MRAKNIKISKLLNIGLGILLLIVILFGVLSFYISEQLWGSTQGLYEHPFTVQGALSKIHTNVLTIRLELKELVAEKTPKLTLDHVSNIDIAEADIFKQIEILNTSYLGPKSDIESLRHDLVSWKSIRDETLRVYREEDYEIAQSQVRFTGSSGIQAIKIISDIEIINKYASNKALTFYSEAMKSRNRDNAILTMSLCLIFILTAAISIFLSRAINKPLKELTRATDQFQKGSFEARCDYPYKNEFGELSNSFNGMAKTVETEINTKQNIAKVSQIMISSENINDFYEEILFSLMTLTQSQMGAVHVLNRKTDCYETQTSTGYSYIATEAISKSLKQGDLGLAINSDKITHISEIPNDANINFTTFQGELRVKEIITIPVKYDDEVVMLISLGNIRNYRKEDALLVEGIYNELTARVNSLLNSQKVENISNDLKIKNTELQQQTKELSMQTDELVEQNIELEMQKKQLDEASRLKSSFLSNMSHELRTPLNSVIALSSVLQRKLKDVIPETEHSYLDVIERNGKNLLSLVNDLLDLSKIESGKIEIIKRKFNVNALVNDTIELINPQAERKNIKIFNTNLQNNIIISSDEEKVRHILQNLIGNAVKFTDIGEVKVTTTVLNDEVQISIADSGIGISKKHIDMIFDEFRQADESTSKRNGGTGLGLAIAKKYALMLRGNIKVDSELDIGSVFTLTLPTSLGQDTKVSINEKNIFDKPANKLINNQSLNNEKRILLVDDSEPVIIQTSDILSESGYKVFVARNGFEALEKIAIVKPHGMILDLMMPEMDGFDVLRAIRDVKENERVPVLILSAKHITKDELSFLKSNHVSQLIQKGDINKTELLKSVEKLVFDKQIIDDNNIQYSDYKNNDQQTNCYSIDQIGNSKNNSNYGDYNNISIDETFDVEKNKKIFSEKFGRKPSILIIEDNIDNMITINSLLEEDFILHEAYDGVDGVNKAIQMKPDLILMDISLPKMDGYQSLEKIKEHHETGNIKVIALTARAMTGDMEEIMSHGFDDYQTKPIDYEALLNSIWRHLL